MLRVLLVGAEPAAASCAPPAGVGENARRADVMAHEHALSVNGRVLAVAVNEVLKGNLPATVKVFVGPERAVATNVDDAAQAGGEQVLSSEQSRRRVRNESVRR